MQVPIKSSNTAEMLPASSPFPCYSTRNHVYQIKELKRSPFAYQTKENEQYIGFHAMPKIQADIVSRRSTMPAAVSSASVS